MRQPRLVLAVLALALAVGAGPSSAQDKDAPKLAGKYTAKFSSVANNCSATGMSLSTASVEVSQEKGRNMSVTIPSVPIMTGLVSRGGKFRAVTKRGKTAIEGVDGKFSAAGRVEKGVIHFLFIAEYFRGEKPLCTQSWNATGPRQ